jgi:dihydrofolate reductase
MSKLRVHAYSISADGYGAGPNQSLENPLGEGGERLHEWFIPTSTFQRTFGRPGGETGPDDDVAARGIENIGASILGRNMFAHSRGAWADDNWKGWWGDNPPYHSDVFILTHHARDPIAMEGGTTFHFVTDGIHAALERAKASAGGKDVRLGGGANVIRQYLQAGLVDEMHVAVSPILLGGGEPLYTGLDLPALGLKSIQYTGTPRAAHYIFSR